MSNTPVKKEETSPFHSDVSSNSNYSNSSSNSNSSKVLPTPARDENLGEGDRLDLIVSMLTKLDQKVENIDSRVSRLEFKSKNRTPVEETLAKASVKLEEVAASMVQETPMEEDQFYKQFCSTEGDDQFYQQGLLTEMKIDDKMNLPKHVGRTKLIAAPTSGKAVRPQSLTQDMVEDNPDYELEKTSEPPDIEKVMERVLLKNEQKTRAVILEEVRQHLLVVGAIKDEDVRRARMSQQRSTCLDHDDDKNDDEVTHGVEYVERAVNEIVDWPELLNTDADETRAFKDERSRVPSVLALAGEANNPASLKATFKGFILQELSIPVFMILLNLSKTYKERYPSEWRRQWYLTVDPKVWTEVRTRNFDKRSWCDRFIADTNYPIAVEGLERGFAADQITDRELLTKTINSARSAKSLKLKFVLKAKAALQDLPESRFTLMLLVAITPRTPVQFHTAWRASMKPIVEDLGLADWSDTSEKNFYHRKHRLLKEFTDISKRWKACFMT